MSHKSPAAAQGQDKLGDTHTTYDSFSVEPTIWVRWGDESESGQMVLKKVKVTYFDKQCEIIQKNQWKSPNFQI